MPGKGESFSIKELLSRPSVKGKTGGHSFERLTILVEIAISWRVSSRRFAVFA